MINGNGQTDLSLKTAYLNRESGVSREERISTVLSLFMSTAGHDRDLPVWSSLPISLQISEEETETFMRSPKTVFKEDGTPQPNIVFDCTPKALESLRGNGRMNNMIVLISMEKFCREVVRKCNNSGKREVFVTYRAFSLYRRFQNQTKFTILNLIYAIIFL